MRSVTKFTLWKGQNRLEVPLTRESKLFTKTLFKKNRGKISTCLSDYVLFT